MAEKQTFDVVVIGGGLAGVVAAKKIADQGQQVAVIRKGYGATALSSGCFDIADNKKFNTNSTLNIIDRINQQIPEHPYSYVRIAGLSAYSTKIIPEAFTDLIIALEARALGYYGVWEDYLSFSSCLGKEKNSNFAQETLYVGNYKRMETANILFLGINGLPDFNPVLCSQALLGNRYNISFDYVDFPDFYKKSNLSLFELAKRLEDSKILEKFVLNIHKIISSPAQQTYTHIAFPPILGLRKSRNVLEELRVNLGIDIFEVPAIIPSVPGLRLQLALDELLNSYGIPIISGNVINVLKEKNKIRNIIVKNNQNEISIYGSRYVLASGKFLGGGLSWTKEGIKETIFDLPVFYQNKLITTKFIEELLCNDPLAPHPVFSCGIKTNNFLQPINEKNDILYENIFAAGSILNGYNYIHDKCGLGVALFTGYCAGKNAVKI